MPHTVRRHTHVELLFEIVKTMTSRQGDVRLSKVRAHTGVTGNELADALAKRAATTDNTTHTVTFDGPLAPPESDDDCDHSSRKSILQRVQRAYMLRTKTKTGQYMCKLEADRIALAPTNHFINNRNINTRARKNAIRLRYRCMRFPNPRPDGGCHLCATRNCFMRDTFSHLFGACIHPAIKELQTLYHNEAVHLIANAIEAGEYGGCALLVNAGAGPNGRQSANTVPPQLLPGYAKRPDICLMQGWTKAKLERSAVLQRYPRPHRDRSVRIVFIEFCFTNDYFIPEQMIRKQNKYTPAPPLHPPLVNHRHLIEELRARGFTTLGTDRSTPPGEEMLSDTAPLMPVVAIGHSGVILERNLELFRALGMSATQATALANNLNLLAVKRMTAILNMRQELLTPRRPATASAASSSTHTNASPDTVRSNSNATLANLANTANLANLNSVTLTNLANPANLATFADDEPP